MDWLATSGKFFDTVKSEIFLVLFSCFHYFRPSTRCPSYGRGGDLDRIKGGLKGREDRTLLCTIDDAFFTCKKRRKNRFVSINSLATLFLPTHHLTSSFDCFSQLLGKTSSSSLLLFSSSSFVRPDRIKALNGIVSRSSRCINKPPPGNNERRPPREASRCIPIATSPHDYMIFDATLSPLLVISPILAVWVETSRLLSPPRTRRKRSSERVDQNFAQVISTWHIRRTDITNEFLAFLL